MNKPDTIPCRDACGRSVPVDEVERSGWELLPVQNRWRCPVCWRALRTVNARAEQAEPTKGVEHAGQA